MSLTRTLRHACLSALGVGSLAAISAGCLDRPVAPATPKTYARVTDRVRQNAVDKIDLLFMLDNSISMADKQLVLAKAVPDLVSRLVDPTCVKLEDGEEIPVPKTSEGECPEGAQREFEAVKDIHIAVISSSIGANGANQCRPGQGYDPTMEDMGHLLSRGPNGTTIATYQDKGFLQWDPAGEKNPPGEADEAKLSETFRDMVIGVGQSGCGYEQSLEAVYRFLVDPDPYKEIQLVHEEGRAIPAAHLVDVDEKLLQQRADFLRPDSLVAIVSLSDENDCSTIAGDRWYTSLQSRYGIPRANSACAENPHDECCGPCRGWQAPAHCLQPADDPACQVNDGRWDTASRPPEIGYNLRCFDQKRRFGIDFLYPTQRYIDGIQQRVVPNRQGEMVANPLFMDLQCEGTNCKPERDDSFIFWAMIVGVPWQDIARVDKDGVPDLTLGYMTTSEMAELRGEGENKFTRWDVILGDPQASPPVPPLDPLMIESIEEREGTHPITGDPIVPTATNPPLHANPINGHERNIKNRDDLQYACIFRLPEANQEANNDCGSHVDNEWQDPLCQNPADNTYGTTQYSAKAYPGTRHLEVAKGLGEQAIVASICPANLEDEDAPDFGYRPAIGALIERLKTRLRDRCLPRALEPNVCVEKDDPTYGQVPCVILEALTLPEGEQCNCETAGRTTPAEEVITDDVREAGNCICEITQLQGDGLHQCEEQPDETKVSADGWCYVDPGQGIGNEELVSKCIPTERRIIRFVNKGHPTTNSTVFITCQEGAFNPNAAPGSEPMDPCAQL